MSIEGQGHFLTLAQGRVHTKNQTEFLRNHCAILNQILYSLYKKKRKHYIIFNNLRTFEDEHFKLTGDLNWHVPYQVVELHNVSCTITSRFPSSRKGTHETKSHKNSM